MSVSVDRPQSHIPWKRSLSVKLDELHFIPIGILITLYVCLILFIPNLCLCCTAMLSNISKPLKHYMLQWGGVLPLVHTGSVSCIVSYCVYTCVVSHPMTVLINDTS